MTEDGKFYSVELETGFIGPNQIKILEAIVKTPGINNPEIRELVGDGPATTVYHMRKNGYIYAKPGKSRRVATQWFPTRIGKVVVSKIEKGEHVEWNSWQKFKAIMKKNKTLDKALPITESPEQKPKLDSAIPAPFFPDPDLDPCDPITHTPLPGAEEYLMQTLGNCNRCGKRMNREQIVHHFDVDFTNTLLRKIYALKEKGVKVKSL